MKLCPFPLQGFVGIFLVEGVLEVQLRADLSADKVLGYPRDGPIGFLINQDGDSLFIKQCCILLFIIHVEELPADIDHDNIAGLCSPFNGLNERLAEANLFHYVLNSFIRDLRCFIGHSNVLIGA